METFFLKKVLPAFLLALALALHTVPGFAQGGGGCSSIVFSAEHYEPCCYRLHIVSNVSECISNPITLLLNAGSFASWGASTQTGWTGTLISPTELRLTHNSGIIPIGASTPVGFCLPPGVSPTLTVLYDYTCPLGKSCVVEFPLAGCPIVADASISGVKYVDIGCTHLPYTNQPTLPGWTIQLLNSDNVLLDSTVTDANGAYSFTDLPAGQYVCREASKPGWTPGLPASGQHNLTLGQSQMLVRNFGNCPPCSCESIYFSLNPLPGPPDTCCYSLTTQNTAPYCFPFINIHLAAGHFTSSMVLTPGWTITSVDPQNIQLHPPGGTTVPAGFAIPVKFCVTGAAQQNILVSTGWNNGMQSFNCPAEFSFACPQPPVLCCPAGSMQGPQQVVNGDFTAGNTGFTPFFPFFTPGGPTAVGSYSVLQSNQVFAANPQWAATDHTAGTATGKMLIVDGANANGNIVWREMVNVQLGVQYAFCAWANNLVLPTKNLADPVVQLWINGNMVATSTLSEVPDKWILINNLWTANVIGLIPIEIRLGSIQAGGNDFAVDDISFRSCSAEAPCQVSTTVTQIDHCGHVQIHATVTGPQPYTVQWCNGQTGPDLDLHLPCGPYSCAVSVTCANGSTATSTATVVVVDTIPPLAKCLPGIGVVLNANCTATATAASIDNGSSDNCLIQSITLSPNTFTKCGLFPVTLTVTDWCGNTATCTSSVQVHEGIPPFPKGTNNITCFARDACGNASPNCNFTLTVVDNQPPTITCPGNVTVQGLLSPPPNQLCKAIVNGLAPTVTDNCPNWTVSYVITGSTTGLGANNASGTNFMQGVSTVTYTVTDCGMNTKTCTVLVTVVCIPMACLVCPPNSVQGPELVNNGDFANGYNGFGNQFRPKFTPGSNTVAGGFSILNSLQVPLANPDWSCLDHSTGSSSGKFLVCDGPSSFGTIAWEQIIQVQPGRHYNLCLFANNLHIVPPTPGDYDPEVEILINSIPVTGPITIPKSPDDWLPISASWASDINTMAHIEIRSIAVNSIGNDLALDDVSFHECMTDTSYCGPFSNMFVGKQGEAGQAVACGDTMSIICQTGSNPTFTGTFICYGTTGAPQPQVDWVLTNPASNTIASGTALAVPYFGMALPSSYFLTSGTYMLHLTGHCGSQECTCVIYLLIEACTEPCPCNITDVQTFKAAVNKGFANVLWNNSCKVCFSPLALNDCETVDWKINGFSVGTSVGNQPFCQLFSNPGTYAVTMIVTRKKSDGEVCETFSKSQNVEITCSVPGNSVSGPVPNPQFTQGANVGGLNTGGASQGWAGPVGNPVVLINGVEMATDSSSIFISGNKDGGDVLSTDTAVCWPQDTGMISFRTKLCWMPLPPIIVVLQPIPDDDEPCLGTPCTKPPLQVPAKPGETVHLRLYQGNVASQDLNTCDSSNCYEIGAVQLPLPDSAGVWLTVEIPYDIRIWDPNGGGCTPNDPFSNRPGLEVRPAIYITNWLGNNQGDSHSVMILDGINYKDLTVAVNNLLPIPNLRIFPNPNSGTFSVELPSPADREMTFRITDLTGRGMLTRQTDPGSQRQTVDAGNLPPGLYFLQVVAGGRVLAVEKFVKQ